MSRPAEAPHKGGPAEGEGRPAEAKGGLAKARGGPAEDVGGPAKHPGGRRLVLGYDRSESARAAAAWAGRELRGSGTLVIVHACRPLHAPPSPLLSSRERHELGRALIDELLLESGDALLGVKIEVVISDDDPVSALIAAAAGHEALAIVVGCELHSRLHKAIGTVTSELLKRSSVPVFAIPFSARAPDAEPVDPPMPGRRARKGESFSVSP